MFWAHFEALTRIARPPRNEDAAIEHVRRWAAAHGFAVRQDSGRNLCIYVPATEGREHTPTLILQGHLDMVCERRPDSPNDAAQGRIELLRDGDWLTANGTTLGADDGVAIAAMMALAENRSLPHGPLELLMTVAEEVGLEGANALDGSMVTGSVLLNLDAEDDGHLTVGCAGSTDSWIRVSRPRAAADAGWATLDVTVSGGLGGHSGSDIARGRSNAIKVLGRALREAHGQVPFRLASVDGGTSRNAIPREAGAVVLLPPSSDGAFRDAVDAVANQVRDQFATTDPDVTIATAQTDAASDAWSVGDTAALLDLVAVVPTGPRAMSPDFAGLTETSTSLGEAVTGGDQLTLHSLSRSANDAALPDVIASLAAAARLAGGTFEVKHNHPGWRPDLDSPVLAAARGVFRREFGHDAVISGAHAGLEPAVIGGKVDGLDMLAIGPEIQFPHSPDERVSIPSVERFWRLLVGLADELSAPATDLEIASAVRRRR